MSDLTDEEQKFFDTGGEAEITPEVKSTVEEEVNATEEKSETKDTQEKQEKTVPYGALHEERQLRKQAQEQARKLSEQIDKFTPLQEELKAWREAQRQQKDEADAEQDPLNFVAKKLDETTNRLNQFEQHQQTTTQQQNEQNQFINAVHSQITEFMETQPEYPQALQYFINQRNREYEMLGYSDPMQRRQLVDEEAMNIARHALNLGRNPAQAVWDMATARGFNIQKDNKTDTKLETIAKGQKTAKTVSSSGSSPEAELSLTDIERMDDEEFDKLWAEMAKQG